MNKDFKSQLETINQQLKELAGLYKEAVSHSGLSDNQFWIWYALIVIGGEYTQQDICEMWSLSKQTVNTIVTNMVDNGYIALEVVPNTRNRKIIRLTEKGRKYGEEYVMPISHAEQKAFEKLSEHDREACSLAVAHFIAALKEEIHDITYP